MMKLLKEDPTSRRNIISLWNPHPQHQRRLPPCHYTFQVRAIDGKLSGHLTQRSADFPVGVPFNISFYSAFLYMLAQQADLEPWELMHTTVDSHIYVNQIEGVEAYLSRPTPDSPRLEVRKASSIEEDTPADFKLTGYHPEDAIMFPVAV